MEEDLTGVPPRLAQGRGDQAIRENEQKASEAEKQALVLKRRGLEKEIEVFEQKIKENLVRQGGAKTNAELEAFKKEGGYFHEQKSGLETQVLDMFDAEAGFESRIAEAEERVAKGKAGPNWASWRFSASSCLRFVSIAVLSVAKAAVAAAENFAVFNLPSAACQSRS